MRRAERRIDGALVASWMRSAPRLNRFVGKTPLCGSVGEGSRTRRNAATVKLGHSRVVSSA